MVTDHQAWEAAEAVLRNLGGRKGFDWILDDMGDGEDADELRRSLADTIRSAVNGDET